MSHIVKEVLYHSDNEYKCILPIFIDNKIISDVMCLKDEIIYNYQDIKGNSSSLDYFVNSLNQYGYDLKNWNDVAASSNVDGLNFYKENILSKHFMVLENYKGIYTINDVNGHKPKKIELFDNDVYQKEISIVFNNYYVVADYNSKYRFNKFLIVDLTNNKVSEIGSSQDISFDSYIQGTNKNSIYLFDKDNKKQYEINLKTKKIIEVGNENTNIKIYKNGEWIKETALNVKNKTIVFDREYQSDIENNQFIKIDKVGGEKTGYYYFYKKSGSEYIVYRAPVLNSNQLMYLFKTTDLNRVSYYEDYIYYLSGNKIKYFNEKVGSRTIIDNRELGFNTSLTFGLYAK